MEDVQSNVVVPKKRGRPAKGNAVKKEPTGRGRGRPAKNTNGSPVPKKEKPVAANGAEDDGADEAVAAEEKKRGRPAKPGVKSKLAVPAVASGRGRGRPKAEDDGHASPSEKVKPNKEHKKLGRPRKEEYSDDASDVSKDNDEDDEEERRPVGRPSTGAVNLNIESTGRGKGRPKKEVQKRANGNGNVDADAAPAPKKRGRPALDKDAAPKAASGKPRGRPKSSDDDDANDDEDDDEEANGSANEANGGNAVVLDDSDDKDDGDD